MKRDIKGWEQCFIQLQKSKLTKYWTWMEIQNRKSLVELKLRHFPQPYYSKWHCLIFYCPASSVCVYPPNFFESLIMVCKHFIFLDQNWTLLLKLDVFWVSSLTNCIWGFDSLTNMATLSKKVGKDNPICPWNVNFYTTAKWIV